MLNQEQQKIADALLKYLHNNTEASLAGSAGTGKTYTAISLARSYKGSVTLSATTNKAVSVLKEFGGAFLGRPMTVHSFLGLKLEWSRGKYKLIQDPDKINETDLLIVDESSMIDSELYTHIQAALWSDRVKNVLFIGDPYQLPPISKSSLDFLETTPFKLQDIVRQEQNNPIILQATRIRELIQSKSNTLYNIEEISPHITVTTNYKTWLDEFINNEGSKSILSFLNSVVDNHNFTIRRILKPDAKEFEEGESIIAQEVYEKDGNILITNGEELIVDRACLQDGFWEIVDIEGRRFNTPSMHHKQRLKKDLEELYTKKAWEAYKELKSYFLTVKYAYACTIHKSQGSSWESVYIDLRYMGSKIDTEMKNRLIYVALTRASKSVKVLL
ncbi:MAG: ATP-dependent RecD-like DNA helicase [Campylobacterales bacterium]